MAHHVTQPPLCTPFQPLKGATAIWAEHDGVATLFGGSLDLKAQQKNNYLLLANKKLEEPEDNFTAAFFVFNSVNCSISLRI